MDCPIPVRYSDEYYCRDCGRRWSADEDRPECNRFSGDPADMVGEKFLDRRGQLRTCVKVRRGQPYGLYFDRYIRLYTKERLDQMNSRPLRRKPSLTS